MTDRPAENETFVILMQVAAEDRRVGQELLAILRLAPYDRRSLLHTFLVRMGRQGAPEEFRQAVAALLDHAVADQARDMLESIQ